MELDPSVVQLFEQSGFGAKEARVYAALLLLGEADATRIAVAAKVKRTNVYPLLEHLKKRGYVSEVEGRKVRSFSPADPTKVFRHLESSAKLFREMLPFLQAYVARGGTKPRIQYYEGKSAVTSVFREISQFPEACFISSIARLQHVFPEDVRLWEQIYVSNRFKIHARALHTDTPPDHTFIQKIEGKRYEARFLPKGVDLTIDFSLYGENMAISSVTKDPFIVVIESKDLADSMRTIFDLLWKNMKRSDH